MKEENKNSEGICFTSFMLGAVFFGWIVCNINFLMNLYKNPWWIFFVYNPLIITSILIMRNALNKGKENGK